MKSNILPALCAAVIGTRILGYKILGTRDMEVEVKYISAAATVGASLVFSLSHHSTACFPTASHCFYLPEKSSDLQSTFCVQVEPARGYGEGRLPSPSSPQAMNEAVCYSPT